MKRMTPSAPNPIDVVEAGYRLDLADREWLANLTQVVYPLIDGGRGIAAYEYDLTKPPSVFLRGAHMLDMSESVQQAFWDTLRVYSSAEVAKWQNAPTPLASLSWQNARLARQIGVADPFESPVFQDCLARMNARDVYALRTVEVGTKGLVFCSPQRDLRDNSSRVRAVWAKVAAHLAAGRRLREAVAASSTFEAVLTPGGRVDHAEGEVTEKSVRDVLRDAVLRQEHARGRARREDPDGATEMWPALVSGRWPLVDHFERGGRRFIVARRNEHACRDPRTLGARERDVANLVALGKSNKLIGYELGIAEPTVASHLRSAMRKLGATSRVELVQLLGAKP
jgi:DNA-binding CsgD family transcriptional regulator